ncbi:hypothetical protein AK830_g6379 [Neonectria ditissima]|uniref:Aminoglycoside phosphotransferase domain-containing protein n=1 Tax=Neonectria ditissima TaxID=78410 RepID=A0A0P7BIP3_9HYPO|nr:hypothetical protein AK830_g6379 [Neonectria ditissima]
MASTMTSSLTSSSAMTTYLDPSLPQPCTSSSSMALALPSYQCTIREDRTLPPSSQCVAQSCNLARDNITRSARPFFSVSVPSSSTSMTSIPPDRLVRSLLSGFSPGLSVQELEAVPSARLQLLYNVKVSDGPSLLFALPPPAVMRLLRSEKSSIGSEAAVLKWLSGLIKGKKTPVAAVSRDAVVAAKALGESPGSQSAPNPLSEYLPVLVRHESGGRAVEYNLSRPPRGVAISSLARPLTRRQRRMVDFQIGQLLRRISKQSSPTRRFGIAADVLSVPPSSCQPQRLEGGLHTTRGADSWSVAFHALLESVLRDGEDLAIMISYGTIRRHFDRFEHLLDAVTQPHLVVVDVGDDINTLVSRSSETGQRVVSHADGVSGKWQDSKGARRAPFRSGTSKIPADNPTESDETDSEDEEAHNAVAENQGKRQIEVTGLRQWANCIFGDPLIASVFSKLPSRDFWHGFDRPLPEDGEDSANSSSSIVEDEPNAHIRLLLYECYHAVVAVVREFYRPQTDSSKRELAARKQLGSVLARLDELDDLGRPRRRRPSGEMSPAKRPRSGDEDESYY